MLLSLYRSLRSYRGFILGNVKREFQARYRNSLFGALWAVLNSLSMIIIYTVIFSQIMRARLPGMALLALIPLLILQVVFAAGLGMLPGILNVFFRDVGQMFGICLQFWFWLTPIVYPLSILPPGIQHVISLNPMTALMTNYQNVFLYNQWPDRSSLTPLLIIGLVLCAMALHLFRQRVGKMVDEL
ncbi:MULTISPECIES: ABC transporter permease [Pseudomonas]|uniref:ABC-2 family transporter n=1 Tax=Pseudomonas jessenii TaxID=77298 RepID=A0A370SP78_PSEJE|nr:ABC transporter permease [Pseudomonas jessenii]RDL21567.1 ABC-2 family transporter [Pseudomonas jessenii]